MDLKDKGMIMKKKLMRAQRKKGEKENTNNEEKKEKHVRMKQIIEEDNFELVQQETEKKKDIILKDIFFEIPDMQIPIVHYCIMKKAMKCFKFLVLNGADLSQFLIDNNTSKYEWDCISIAVCFGEWEMMKILEERGINKLNNPNVWEAAALTHRNKLLKLLISNKDQIPNIQECLKKGIFGAMKGNNLKGLKILITHTIPNILDNSKLWVHIFDQCQIEKIFISEGLYIHETLVVFIIFILFQIMEGSLFQNYITPFLFIN